MIDFLFLIPIALGLGAVGLAAFLWSMNSGQYEDLDGAAARILFDDPNVPAGAAHSAGQPPVPAGRGDTPTNRAAPTPSASE